MAATTLIKRRHSALDRTTLRLPFYARCYLTAPFALGPGRAFVLASWSFLKAGVYNVALSTVLLVLT